MKSKHFIPIWFLLAACIQASWLPRAAALISIPINQLHQEVGDAGNYLNPQAPLPGVNAIQGFLSSTDVQDCFEYGFAATAAVYVDADIHLSSKSSTNIPSITFYSYGGAWNKTANVWYASNTYKLDYNLYQGVPVKAGLGTLCIEKAVPTDTVAYNYTIVTNKWNRVNEHWESLNGDAVDDIFSLINNPGAFPTSLLKSGINSIRGSLDAWDATDCYQYKQTAAGNVGIVVRSDSSSGNGMQHKVLVYSAAGRVLSPQAVQMGSCPYGTIPPPPPAVRPNESCAMYALVAGATYICVQDSLPGTVPYQLDMTSFSE